MPHIFVDDPINSAITGVTYFPEGVIYIFLA